MRAIIFESGQADLREVPDPVPAADEVLIRVRAAGICGTDLELLRGYAGFSGIPGHEFVGTVIQGPAHLNGKRVVGEINCVCGRCELCAGGLSNHCPRRTVLGIIGRAGAFAEFVTLPEPNCHVVPEGVSDDEAVFAEPLAAACQVPRHVKLERKARVAVLGTGRLGLLVAQVLAHMGIQVIAIGRNPRTLALLDRWRIRTSRMEDLRRLADQDVVVECTGSPEGIAHAMKLVRPRGTIVLKSTCAHPATVDLSPLVVNEVTVVGSRCGPFDMALAALGRHEIDVAGMITRRMPLSVEALEIASHPDQIKVMMKVSDA